MGTKFGMSFDMNAAWERAFDLVKENFQLLAIVASVFFLLPSLAIYLLAPDTMTALSDPALFSDPDADPELVLEQFQQELGPIFAISGLIWIVQFAGYGAMVALMSRGRPTVGESVLIGAKAMPSTFALLLIFFLLYFVTVLIIAVPFGLIGSLLGMPALGAIAAFPAALSSIWILARMSLSLPVLILEKTLNPFKATLRSFKLTHQKQWMVLLFWTVLFVGYLIFALLFTSVLGLVAGLAGGGVLGSLILGLSNGATAMALGMLMCGLGVAIYEQLAGPQSEDVAEVFE
ncbi:MAG: hypothetical protein AAF553_08010 [Pseudomonadota bacterium]